MSEVQGRGGTRGRGNYRGGRGGFRGGRNPSRSHHKAENEQENIPPTTLGDQGEVGELKKKFGDKVPLLREVCPGWSDEDLVYALQETNGDVEAAVDRISTGTISQWGEVKKKQPKSKDAPLSVSETTSTRSRGRGNLESRGRGRGTERGGRPSRGTKLTSHTSKAVSKPEDGIPDGQQQNTETNGGWEEPPTNGDTTTATTEWANDPGKDSLTSLATDEPRPASGNVPVTKKPGGWAGLFAKPPPKSGPPVTSAPSEEIPNEASSIQRILPPPMEAPPNEDGPSDLPSAPHSDTAGDLTPSKDELTQTNLEQLPDLSHPIQTATAASTVASTQDPLIPTDSTKPAIRPGMSGYAASALKATTGTGRSASFTRRVVEQQEAVVMPGNHAVEKTAVQFGKMGLNGSDDIDVDEDREEPETRTQLPDDSPTAPRASLPTSLSENQAPISNLLAEPTQITRQAPGLPPITQQPSHSSPQSNPVYADQYRYGQVQKNYDPFGQQSQQQPQHQQAQEAFSSQVPTSSQAHTSNQNDYANYYGRDAYQNYYANYSQGQENQRSGNNFGTSSQESQGQYTTTRPQPSYAGQEAQNSGNNTPNPTIPTNQPSQHIQNQNTHAGYPYGYPSGYNPQQYPQYGGSYMNQMSNRYGANRPMFDDVRRQDSDYYGNQYGYGHNQQQYGSSYKSNMYGQPQQYSYDQQHSSSPANVGTFTGREGTYGRTGSTQPSEAQQTGNNNFGGVPDPFGRTSSGFGQSQAMSQQHNSHQGVDDNTKPSGPSPSIQGGRPNSAINNSAGQHGGLPQQSQQSQQSGQHSTQQAFGGYPQYGGGLGGQQNTHQATNYGGYGSNAFNTYGYGGGRGWNGGNYGASH